MFVQSPPQPPPSPHAAAPAAPFTPHEHALFVEGVEVFCNQSGAPVGDAAWRHIAAHVRTRTPDEIKAHAQYYLMSLQSRNPEITRVPPRPVRAAARGRRAGTRAAKTYFARARRSRFASAAARPRPTRVLPGSRRRRARGRRRGRRRRTRPSRTPSRPTRRATRTDGRRSPRSSRPSPPRTCSSGTSGSSGTSSRSSAARGNEASRGRRRPRDAGLW